MTPNRWFINGQDFIALRKLKDGTESSKYLFESDVTSGPTACWTSGSYSFHPTSRAAADDPVDIPGDGQYQVVGDPVDYGRGPFGFRPGLVLNLRKATW